MKNVKCMDLGNEGTLKEAAFQPPQAFNILGRNYFFVVVFFLP
jgi:hypothetical protein